MCLFVDEEKTKALIERCRKSGNEWISFYKRYKEVFDEGIRPPFQREYKISLKTNEVRAKGSLQKVKNDFDIIEEGAIHGHCMCNLEELIRIYGRHFYILKCWGNIKDLVAVGKHKDICFKKIYIDEKDYKFLVEKYLPGYYVE